MEKLSELLAALETLYDDEGDMKVLLRSGRNQNGEAVHRLRRAAVKEFNGTRSVVFEAVDEPDLGGR